MERESPCGADGVLPFQPPPLAPDATIRVVLAGVAVSTLNRRAVQSALFAVVSGRRIVCPRACASVGAALSVTVPRVLIMAPEANASSISVVRVMELSRTTWAAVVYACFSPSAGARTLAPVVTSTERPPTDATISRTIADSRLSPSKIRIRSPTLNVAVVATRSVVLPAAAALVSAVCVAVLSLTLWTFPYDVLPPPSMMIELVAAKPETE